MLKRSIAILIPLVVTVILILHAQTKAGAGFAAVPKAVSGQDTFDTYEVVKG